MFDTHAHLNFSRFKKNIDEIIYASKSAGVTHVVIPGTDIESSKRAVKIATANDGMYAAVGIHPHHVFVILSEAKDLGHMAVTQSASLDSSVVLGKIEELLQNDTINKIVAIGEIGLDRHVYQDTKYENYQINESFMDLQKELFIAQLSLAKKYGKSVIIHNREAKQDLLPILIDHWDTCFEGKMVFHCCEPDEELLQFAKDHSIYIGIDGDVTYREDKQEFIQTVPLEMLVVETDSPFLLPEPLRTQKKYPNSPVNLPLIAEFIATVRGETLKTFQKETTNNAGRLFSIPLL